MAGPRRNVVTLDRSFADALDALGAYLQAWSVETQRELVSAHKQIGQRHQAEAKKRVPVRHGRLRNGIITNVYEKPGEITTETGTNVTYGRFTEFGTKYIAKGNVLRLGDAPEIPDERAVKVWQAKNADRIDAKTGKAHRTAVMESDRRFAGTGVGEQMPWLRSSWSHIKSWALQRIINALIPKQPPKKA